MTSKVIQGHKRWHFYSKKYLFKLYQTWDECLHYKDTIFMKGHIRLIYSFFFTFIYQLKYELRSHVTTFMLWRGCMAFLLSDFLILWQPILTFLWTTFVLVFIYGLIFVLVTVLSTYCIVIIPGPTWKYINTKSHNFTEITQYSLL